MSRSDPTERALPAERGVVAARPDLGGGAATPSFAAADGSASAGTSAWSPARHGDPPPAPTTIGGRRFVWGSRTFVMGIVNVTPDSFSGDGLLAQERPDRAGSTAAGDVIEAGVALARRMVAEGADLLDVGGESSRPGHAVVDAAEETRRVVPLVAAIHRALPDVPISVDTTKPSVAAAALDAGAAPHQRRLGRLPRRRARPARGGARRAHRPHAQPGRGPLHGPHRPRCWPTCEPAIERARAAGVPEASIIVDPGFGFGKAPAHNLALLDGLDRSASLGRPDPARRVAQVDPGQGARPAGRGAAGGDPRHDRPRRPGRGRHRARPRRRRRTSASPGSPTPSSVAGTGPR